MSELAIRIAIALYCDDCYVKYEPTMRLGHFSKDGQKEIMCLAAIVDKILIEEKP